MCLHSDRMPQSWVQLEAGRNEVFHLVLLKGGDPSLQPVSTEIAYRHSFVYARLLDLSLVK